MTSSFHAAFLSYQSALPKSLAKMFLFCIGLRIQNHKSPSRIHRFLSEDFLPVRSLTTIFLPFFTTATNTSKKNSREKIIRSNLICDKIKKRKNPGKKYWIQEEDIADNILSRQR